MTDSTPPTALPAGWYPDQADAGYHRWWDGHRWTEHRQRVQLDPPGADASAPATPSAPIAAPPSPFSTRSGSSGSGATVARNGFATWSLILGVLGLFALILPYAGFAFGAVAVVLGVVGIRSAARYRRGRGVAIAGIVVGGAVALIGAILSVSLTVFLVSAKDVGISAAPVATASASAPPDQTAESPVAEPSPGAAGGESVLDATTFVLKSGNDLDDMDKDLDDIIVTLDEGGFWRLLSNSAELTFNYAQLDSRTPPSSIAEPWASGMATLEEGLTAMDQAIADERNDDLRVMVDQTRSHVQAMRDILATVNG